MNKGDVGNQRGERTKTGSMKQVKTGRGSSK